jgi:hypothetical protein
MTTMNAAIEREEAALAVPTEALVLGAEEEDRARVRLVVPVPMGGDPSYPLARPASVEVRARVAVPGYRPTEGDRVLVQRAADGSVHVLGVLHAARGPRIATSAGASAEVEGERIALRDAAGRLLLTLDGATGELRLEAEHDLRLAAPRGKVVVEASALDLSVGHYELRAERIVERATDAFRTVEGILETRARHARAVVSRTLELFGRRTTIASEEDTRIDGKRVLLG